MPCILYSIGVFVALKDVGTKVMNYKGLAKLLTWLGQYTFSIYLMQFMFLEIIPEKFAINEKAILYRLGAPFIIIPPIIAITWCMRRIPILKAIVP